MVPAPFYGRVPNTLSESVGNLITSCDNGLPRRTNNFSFHSNRHLQIHLLCRLKHIAIVYGNHVAHLSKNVLLKNSGYCSMFFPQSFTRSRDLNGSVVVNNVFNSIVGNVNVTIWKNIDRVLHEFFWSYVQMVVWSRFTSILLQQ